MSAHVTFWGRYKQVLATLIEYSSHCKVVSHIPKVGHRGVAFFLQAAQVQVQVQVSDVSSNVK